MLFYTMILPKQNQIVEFFPTFLNQKNLQYYTCISLLLRNKYTILDSSPSLSFCSIFRMNRIETHLNKERKLSVHMTQLSL